VNVDLALAEKARRVAQGVAIEQERVEFVVGAGKVRAIEFTPDVRRLLDDPDEEVRYNALLVLVIKLGIRDQAMIDFTWRALESDPDETVRQTASLLPRDPLLRVAEARRLDRLCALIEIEPTTSVQFSIYSALHEVVGLPPKEWPEVQSMLNPSRPETIDWSRVAELERLTR
jgi:HEAT repeat protein